MKLFLTILLGLAGVAASAQAAPVLYNIVFAPNPGLVQPSGSFQYDAATGQFSAFTVSAGGQTFDLSVPANSPGGTVDGVCNLAPPDFNGYDAFAFLDQQTCNDFAEWIFTNSGVSVTFTFSGAELAAPGLAAGIYFTSEVRLGGSFIPTLRDQGTFQISPASVPEPSSLVLMLGCGVLLAVRLGRRRSPAAIRTIQ